MKLVQTLICVLSLDCMIVYLFQNAFSGVSSGVATGASSVGFVWLGLALCLAMLGATLRFARAARFGIGKSAAVLSVFLAYFLVKIFVDATDPRDLVSYTLGTSGGLILAYVLGLAAAICMQGILELNASARLARFAISLGLFSFVCLFVILLTLGYADTVANLQTAQLLVTDNSGYQRSGNFLSMIFLLESVAVVGMVFVNKRLGMLDNKILIYGAVAVYVVTVPVLMYEGQLLGSNSVVMFVIATAVPTIAFVFFGLRSKTISGNRVSLTRVAVIGFLAILVLAVLAWGAVNCFNIDIENLRLFNFGQGGVVSTSVTGRLSILRSDYLRQLNYEPLFGNMAVDTLTTGAGTYAHSLPLSLLTHLGIVGLALFVSFVWLRVRELRRGRTWCGVAVGGAARQKNFQLFVFLMLLAILLVASLSAFFVWMPLWFALGVLVPPFNFVPKHERQIDLEADVALVY